MAATGSAHNAESSAALSVEGRAANEDCAADDAADEDGAGEVKQRGVARAVQDTVELRKGDGDGEDGDGDDSGGGDGEGGGGEDGATATTAEQRVECMLTVVAGSEELVLFWVDFDGERHEYGQVDPHGRRSQRTFAGHVWEVAVVRGHTAGAKALADGSPIASRRYRVGEHAPHELIEAGEDLGI